MDLMKTIDERRKLILDYVYKECNGIVKHGPFTGMKILPNYCWGDGDTGGKLLGVYESELFPYIDQIIKINPDLVINYGCAEGYYGIGLGLKLPQSQIVMIDIEQRAIEISRQNAEANNLKNVLYYTKCDLNDLLTTADRPCVLMDCEGAEEYLLDLDKTPALADTIILVEMHEFMRQGMTDSLVYKFNETHELEGIIQGSKDLHVSPIDVLGDTDKWIIANENRPNTMNWVFMVPKRKGYIL